MSEAQTSVWKCKECGKPTRIFNIYHDVLTGKPRTGIHLKCEDKDHRGIERVFIEDGALVHILANYQDAEDLILNLREHIAALENELNGLYERLEEE